MVPQLANVFQLAYVTNDVAKAADLFRTRFATGPFTQIEFGDIMTIGLAFAGRTMIEVIQPINDATGIYSGWIAGIDGFALRQHHYGILVDSVEELAAIKAAHVESGTPVATEGSMPGSLDFLYVDTVPLLGHYLEYVRLDEGGKEMFRSVEGSIF